MKESEYILVVVGKKSHENEWMKWEIERAQQNDTKLKFAAVKIEKKNILPVNLPVVTEIANGFTLEGIENILDKAKTYN